jgi:BirA family transcriptional regulator, biotin operon repressor / biotin---[acetyl-CoA-carboxylase] ligase
MGPVQALGQHSLERAVREAGIAARPLWLEVTSSTNLEALRLAEDGAPEWTVVATGHQTAGRGRLGRSWADMPGKALLCTILLRPSLPPHHLPLVGLAAAAALVEAADVPALRSKWPNDLVVGERKVGGILPESTVEGERVRHVVLGIGVNVGMEVEDFARNLRGSATSLALEGGGLSREELLTAFLARFRPLYEALPKGAVERYRRVCATIGRRVVVWTTFGEVLDGRALDLDPFGELIVQSQGAQRTISFGEVDHLREADPGT